MGQIFFFQLSEQLLITFQTCVNLTGMDGLHKYIHLTRMGAGIFILRAIEIW